LNVQLTRSPIDVGALLGAVGRPGAGAVAVFLGTVRDRHAGRAVTGLHYDAYVSMAIRSLEQIGRDAESRWPIESGVLVHRLGDLEIGEASVVAAVACAHRAEAFEACRFLIERTKTDVPIWKRESYAEGVSAWLDGSSGAAATESPSAAATTLR